MAKDELDAMMGHAGGYLWGTIAANVADLGRGAGMFGVTMIDPRSTSRFWDWLDIVAAMTGSWHQLW